MITFEDVSKVYPDGTVAVDNLTITAPNGKITTLVGPSGCGKTTSMRMINRLIEPTSGSITLDGTDTQTLDKVALRRRIGYVIQNAGLFPHRTVVDNVAALPRLLGGGKKETRSAAMELLERVGLDAKFARRYPWQLSGGQQQRVGVARALATDPPFLLMDEPFSAVDPIVRSQLQDEFLRLQADISKTIVMVTHDIDEALKLGDQVVVLRQGGTLAQAATPAELLAAPRDAFVADFVGKARGYRALGFHNSDDLLKLNDEPTITVGQPVSAIVSTQGRWMLVVDDRRAPLGWVDTETVRGDCIQDSDVNLSATSASRDDPLRDLLNSALSSPSSRCVITDETGALIGTASDHDVMDGGVNWISSNIDRIVSLTISHAWLTLVPTIVGLLIALPLGWWAHKFKRGQAAIVGTAGLLYTIPSLALFIILPTILGTKILDPLNIVVALTLYTLALLVRVVTDGLDSVPHDTVAAAEAMGYRGWQRLLLVELPVAVPVIAAGLRVAVVSNVSIVTMAALLGIPQLGSLFTQGFQLRLFVPLVTGILLCVVLAVVFDGLIIWLNRLLTPWRQRTVTS
jgi:osmoprotectant transport system ATP-binding protein